MTAVRHDVGNAWSLLVDWLDEHGLRYEILDGSVVVTPPAGLRHESLVMRLGARLVNACPPGLIVVGSSYACRYGDGSFVMPDISVVSEATAHEDGADTPPLLAVEILSRSSRRYDLLVKRQIYAEWGVPTYWIVDPVAPSLTVLELRGGTYAETSRTAGSELLHVERPSAVDVRLS